MSRPQHRHSDDEEQRPQHPDDHAARALRTDPPEGKEMTDREQAQQEKTARFRDLMNQSEREQLSRGDRDDGGRERTRGRDWGE